MARVMARVAKDSWLESGANLILFGPPGGGKTHLAAAIGLALIKNGPIAKVGRALFTRTTGLVQKLQVARREPALEAAIARLDKYQMIILDDLAYVTKDQPETNVRFELISARYERRSIAITPIQPFGDWNRIFPDPAMTLAATGRLVHHSTILELKVESYRRREALGQQRGQVDQPPARHPKPKLIDALRQSTPKTPLARNTQSRNPQHAATHDHHPDCRAVLIQIVALQASLAGLAPKTRQSGQWNGNTRVGKTTPGIVF